MQKPIVSFLLAAALTVGGAVAGYAAASKNPQSMVKEAAVNRVTDSVVFGSAAVQVKADTEAVIQKRAEDAAEAQKKAEEAAAKKQAEEEAQKKAEEEAARKQAEAEAAAAAAVAAQNDAAASNYAAQAAVNNNAVQSAPAETAVYTEQVSQPLCPYGHALVSGNMCGYQDCPNGYCYTGNNSYSSGGNCANYDYSGGQHHQYGHGGGHHGY